MVAVGKPGIEKELGLGDGSSCTDVSGCFEIGRPSRATVGTNAGTLYGIKITPSGQPAAGCYLFLHRDSAGWHYDNGRCITAVEQIPSAVSQVYADSGCVNVRDAPSISGHILNCLGGGTKVYVDSAPTYASGHIWWHLLCLGWMAHDFLVLPLGKTSHPATSDTGVQCASPNPPYAPMISLSLDAGTPSSSVVVVGSGFPPLEFTTYYWESHYPGVMGTPGLPPDAQGHFEFDTQDHGAGNQLGFYLPQADDQLCAQVESNQPDSGKACAEYKVVGTTATPTASPSPVPSSFPSRPPSAAPVASVVTPVPQVQIGIGILCVVLMLGIGAAYWLRRRRRR